MADDLRTRICSSTRGSWWNPERSASFNAPASLSCSIATADIKGVFDWTAPDMFEGKTRSCDESAGSVCGSSITYQETHKIQHSDIGSSLIDSTVPSFSLSSSSTSWTEAFLNGGRPENSFHAMLQEDLRSRPSIKHDPTIDSNRFHTGAEVSAMNSFGDMNQNFLLQQHHFSSGNESSEVGGSYHILPTSYGCSLMMLQDLLEPEMKLHQSIYGNRVRNHYQSPVLPAYQGSSNELRKPSRATFSQLINSSLPKQQSNNPLQFTNNNNSLRNASAASSVSDVRPVFCSPTPSKFVMQASEPKTIYSNLTAKMNSQGVLDSCSSSTKKTASEPANKKSRIETTSPLPTSKVRKEKLGDRIISLQQLVSPFGKTDTASVLQEAIEYIKFLHDQVGALSSPYLKNGHPIKQQQISDQSKDCDEPKRDLRSRGLCLAPVTSTYPVASETSVDFWHHPAFGGTFR